MMNPKIDQNVPETDKKRKRLGCLIVFLFIPVLLGVLFYPVLRTLRHRAWCSGRIVAIEREILKPLAEKYDFPDNMELRIPGDISFSKNFVVSFSLEIGDPDRLTEIVKEVYDLKRNSPGLSKEVFDVEIVCSDPRNPVKFRVMMPGENGYEGRWIAYPPDLNPPEQGSKETDGAAE